MKRIYRLFITIDIEGDADTLPPMLEVAETVATLVQDQDEHDFSVCVRPIEIQDFEGDVPQTHGEPWIQPWEQER